MSFADLKKQSKLGTLNDKLMNQLDKLNEKSSGEDDRIWKPTRDKTGNGYAVIRFLPQCQGEEEPFIKIYSHGFQGPGGWYIENSLTTFNQADPVAEYNRELWNTGTDANKDIVRKQKRKLNYYSNIFVISDPAKPENEGKVFLFRYGKKIFDKINSAIKPEFADETPVNVFDFWEGANFKLKIKTVDRYPNYDSSTFDSPSALFDDDSKLEKIWKSQFSLAELVEPSKFKTYEELKKRLDMVLGKKGSSSRQIEEGHDEEEELVTVASSNPAGRFESESSDESDDSLDYFKSLLDD